MYGRHPAVASHRLHCTIQSVEARQEKQGQRERKQKETEEKKREELHVLELWKPHQHTLPWFVSACKE